MAAPSAPPVSDPHAPLTAPGKLTTAERVRAQLQRDYPPGALSWVDQLTWAGPVLVPVAQVDRSSGDTHWGDAAKDTAKIALFKRKIAGGFRKPVVLVRRPGIAKLFAVDGHTRILACLALGVPVTAWVGTAKTAHGSWEKAHARQLANDARQVIELVGPKGYVHGWIKVGVPADSLAQHTREDVKRFPFGSGSEHAGGAPALDLSAQTAALEVTPAPYGRPGGPGLYGVKGQKHSDYFEHIVQAMIRRGKTKAEASAMAWGILRRWAAGGGKVHPEVRAAAAAAQAQEAAKGHAHANDGPAIDLAGTFTEALHPRAAGGKFGFKGGAPVVQARARHAPKTAPVQHPAMTPGQMSRAQQLRWQASQDRQLAHQIMVKVAGLVRARDAAIAGIPAGKVRANVNPAKSAAAKKAALARNTHTAKKKTTARKTSKTSARAARVAKLNGQIKLLTRDARLLMNAANHLDTQANGL